MTRLTMRQVLENFFFNNKKCIKLLKLKIHVIEYVWISRALNIYSFIDIIGITTVSSMLIRVLTTWIAYCGNIFISSAWELTKNF